MKMHAHLPGYTPHKQHVPRCGEEGIGKKTRRRRDARRAFLYIVRIINDGGVASGRIIGRTSVSGRGARCRGSAGYVIRHLGSRGARGHHGRGSSGGCWGSTVDGLRHVRLESLDLLVRCDLFIAKEAFTLGTRATMMRGGVGLRVIGNARLAQRTEFVRFEALHFLVHRHLLVAKQLLAHFAISAQMGGRVLRGIVASLTGHVGSSGQCRRYWPAGD